MSSSTRRAEPCTYEGCGSRRFHVGDDGYTYCERSHQQLDRGTVIAEDTGEFVTYGSKSKRHDSDAESSASRASTYSGPRALEHYLLCVQLVLRKQLQWLIDIQKLPDELEALVKDLWTLRLQKLQERMGYESESDAEGPSSQMLFSSQSESETDKGSSHSRRSQRAEAKASASAPNLVESIAFCYIGSLLLRLPLTVADLCGWINDGQLLYYRAHRELPQGMLARLPGEYERLLEPQDLLHGESVQRAVGTLLRVFRKDFGMEFPQLNTPLVLFRWIRALALPLEMFVATQTVARLLELDFSFDATNIQAALRFPETRLVALLLVATKLFLPFNGNYRQPEPASALLALSMDWDRWSELHRKGADMEMDRPPLTFSEALAFEESDCLESSNERLDAYLAWCADNVASEEARERGHGDRTADFRTAVFAMFPLDPAADRSRGMTQEVDEDVVDTRAQQIMQTAVIRPEVGSNGKNGENRRPGSLYYRFRREEELSGSVKLFYEKAAVLAGISVGTLVQAVFLVERRLQKHEESLRREAKR